MQHIINDAEYNEFMRLREQVSDLAHRINELKEFEVNYKIQKDIFNALDRCWDKHCKQPLQCDITIDKVKLEAFFKFYLLVEDVKTTFNWVD